MSENIEEIETHQLLQFNENVDDRTIFSEYLGELMSSEPEPFILFSNLLELYSIPKNYKNDFIKLASIQLEMMIDILGNSYSEYQSIIESKKFVFCEALISTFINMEDINSISILIENELDTYDQNQDNISIIPGILIKLDLFTNEELMITIYNHENWFMYFEYINDDIEGNNEFIKIYGCESICEYFELN